VTVDIIIFDQIKDVLETVLTFYHDHGASWGWSIVLLTFTVRTAMLPLTVKQYRSMAAMQAIQPKVKALQNRFKNRTSREDKQEMQKQLMELYREHNVNPFASCLPLVVQMPVFLGLYRVLTNFSHADPPGSPAFLGIDNIFVKLSDIGGATPTIIALIYLASMLGSTLLFSFATDNRQKYMFAGMSVFFVFFILQVPVGVGIYWITTNLWTIAQQGIIKETMGHHFPHLQKGSDRGGEGKGGPPDGGSRSRARRRPSGGSSPAGRRGPKKSKRR
jgi:YidC/Oxa1 family membrane protein insertase